MRVTIGTVTAASRALIAIFTAIICIAIIGASREAWIYHLLSNFSLLVVGSSVFTQLAFVAFPKMRRGDVVKAVICLAISFELLYYNLGHEIDLLQLVATIVGAYIVFLASFLERVRTAGRSNPDEPFSLAYKGDRRRSRRRSTVDVGAGSLASPELS